MRVRRQPAGFVSLEGATVAAPRRAYLLTGIARPERVARDLAGQGVVLAGHDAFADHHPFRPQELAVTLRRAEAAGADAVVTTAKDAVRLAMEPLPSGWPPILVFRVRCLIDEGDSFRRRLLAAVDAR